MTTPIQYIIAVSILKVRLRCAGGRWVASTGRKTLIHNRTVYIIQFVVEYDTISSIIRIPLANDGSVRGSVAASTFATHLNILRHDIADIAAIGRPTRFIPPRGGTRVNRNGITRIELPPIGITCLRLLPTIESSTNYSSLTEIAATTARTTAIGIGRGQVLGHDIAGIVVIGRAMPRRIVIGSLNRLAIGYTNKNRSVAGSSFPQVDRLIGRNVIDIHSCHLVFPPLAFINLASSVLASLSFCHL